MFRSLDALNPDLSDLNVSLPSPVTESRDWFSTTFAPASAACAKPSAVKTSTISPLSVVNELAKPSSSFPINSFALPFPASFRMFAEMDILHFPSPRNSAGLNPSPPFPRCRKMPHPVGGELPSRLNAARPHPVNPGWLLPRAGEANGKLYSREYGKHVGRCLRENHEYFDRNCRV